MRVERQTSSLTQATAALPSSRIFSVRRSPGLIASGRQLRSRSGFAPSGRSLRSQASSLPPTSTKIRNPSLPSFVPLTQNPARPAGGSVSSARMRQREGSVPSWNATGPCAACTPPAAILLHHG